MSDGKGIKCCYILVYYLNQYSIDIKCTNGRFNTTQIPIYYSRYYLPI